MFGIPHSSGDFYFLVGEGTIFLHGFHPPSPWVSPMQPMGFAHGYKKSTPLGLVAASACLIMAYTFRQNKCISPKIFYPHGTFDVFYIIV
jgi:hypothetical protein